MPPPGLSALARPLAGRPRLRMGLAGALLLLTAQPARTDDAAAPAAALPTLDALLTSDTLWREGADAFMQAYAPLQFGYVSGRQVARSVSDKLSFMAQRVWEALAYFDKGVVREVSFTVYNRGDAQELDQASFEALVAQLTAGLRKWAGTPGRTSQPPGERANQYVKRCQWSKPPCNVLLEWAYTDAHRSHGVSQPFRAEFVRLKLTPVAGGGTANPAAVGGAHAPVTGYRLKQRVRRSSTGDVWVGDVPMVDQGQKGYCAAATSERLLRYYGRGVDQHDVAQLADTARAGGTSTEGMLDALRRIGGNFQLDVKQLYASDWKSFERLIRDYNRLAEAKDATVITYGNTIDVGKLYAEMDALLLKKARAQRTQEYAAFTRDVHTYVDAGVPLIWSCIVGKFPENPPINATGAFGHMRMIIGYNKTTDEILYTDSWGPGHDLKRMPAPEAWTTLEGLFVVKPRDIR